VEDPPAHDSPADEWGLFFVIFCSILLIAPAWAYVFCNDNLWVPFWGFCILSTFWLYAFYLFSHVLISACRMPLLHTFTRFFLLLSLRGDMFCYIAEVTPTNLRGEDWYSGEIPFTWRAFLSVDWSRFSVSVFLGFRNCLFDWQFLLLRWLETASSIYFGFPVPNTRFWWSGRL
jgi:hypothetical protein